MHGSAELLGPQIALSLFLVGEPKAALLKCTDVWEKHHDKIGNERIMAWNSVVLLKLYLCGQKLEEARQSEALARRWAEKHLGGKRVLKLIDQLKSRELYPCPEWR